jgi:phage tail sheath protein FI
MATTYKTPGVYVEEISLLPPSVAEVETAIPVFIGFTQSGTRNKATRISSLMEYQTGFGTANADKSLKITLNNGEVTITPDVKSQSKYVMFYAMQIYFSNGGGPCYIVSTGNFQGDDTIAAGAEKMTPLEAYKSALVEAGKEDEPTLVVFPDAPFVVPETYYALMKEALDQCAMLGDRFLILDVLNDNEVLKDDVDAFRNGIAKTESAKYGAAYFPYLNTSIPYKFSEEQLSITDLGLANSEGTANPAIKVDDGDAPKGKKDDAAKGDQGARGSMKKFADLPNATQNQIRQKISVSAGVVLSPCAAVAGVYASVDSNRGVWKSPANVALNYVLSTVTKITDDQQKDLNIDVNDGKSINAIRSFIGMGTKIWGARTLAGNDNEWRYINVRRFFNMVEESVKKSTVWAVFEPNDINTWTRVRAMIENYLLLKWKDGALAGSKPDDAYYVRVGLNKTMTDLDVLEGRMIIEIGLAAVRPAEFIILKFSHKLQTS